MERVRVVVAGAGHLGSYHLQKMANDPLAALAGVVELDPERRAEAASRFGIPGGATLDEMANLADAVVIAAPTTSHYELAEQALTLGLHVLVEKPIASSVAQAERMIALARERGRILQVGHTERFNPAVSAALEKVDKAGYIVTERLGPFTGRSTDVDVVLDLMIHDLDIVAALVPAELTEVRAIGVAVLTNEIDMANARLAFSDGTVAQLSAGRSSLEPVRKIRLFTLERYMSIDCAKRQVKSVRRLPAEPGSAWPQIMAEPFDVPAGDPLALQDHDFLMCVREGRTPRVDGKAGLRALQLAQAVKGAMTTPLLGPSALRGN